MGKRIHHLREASEDDVAQLRTLSSSRTQPYRTVQRAKLIVSLIDDKTLTAAQAAKQAGFKSSISGACWVKRFNEKGIQGNLLINRKVANRVFTQRRCGAN